MLMVEIRSWTRDLCLGDPMSLPLHHEVTLLQISLQWKKIFTANFHYFVGNWVDNEMARICQEKFLWSWRWKVSEMVLFLIKNFRFEMAENRGFLHFLHIFWYKMINIQGMICEKKQFFLDPLHSPDHILSYTRKKF